MAVTTVTFTLAGDDKDLSVNETSEIVQQAIDSVERRGKKLQVWIGGNAGMVLEIDPGTFQVTRHGKE